MFKRILLASVVCLMPTAVLAGDYSGNYYTSNLGYSIMLPDDSWARVDASNAAALQKWLPQNISAGSLDRFDAIFYPSFSKVDLSVDGDYVRLQDNKSKKEANPDLSADMLAKPFHETPPEPENLPAFVPTVSVMVVNYKPSSVASEKAKDFADALAAKHDAQFGYASDFKVKSATFDKLEKGSAFVFQMEYRLKSRSVAVEQTALFHNDQTYIITCTSDSNEYVKDKDWCRKVVNSIEFAD